MCPIFVGSVQNFGSQFMGGGGLMPFQPPSTYGTDKVIVWTVAFEAYISKRQMSKR